MKKLLEALTLKEAERENAKKEIEKANAQRDHFIMHTATLQETLQLFQTAVQQTQNLLADSITKIVTTSLASLFEEPYTFIADFIPRRNNIECDLLFERDGERMNPLKECGYGAVDTAAMATRIAIWGMEGESAPILVLDEPWRNLDRKKHALASSMLKSLSEDLGIQFIVVTHSVDLAASADKTFEVSMKNGISTVKELGIAFKEAS